MMTPAGNDEIVLDVDGLYVGRRMRRNLKNRTKPLWSEEFSIRKDDERYVSRRQLTKFLTLTSLGMFVGNLWIRREELDAEGDGVSREEDRARGRNSGRRRQAVRISRARSDQCLLVRTSEDEYVAYSQKCTHLSCAVYYSAKENLGSCT